MNHKLALATIIAGALVAPLASAQPADHHDDHKDKRDDKDAKRDDKNAKRDEHDAKRDEKDAKRDEHDAKRDEKDAKRDEHDAKRDEHDAKRDEHDARRDDKDRRDDRHGHPWKIDRPVVSGYYPARGEPGSKVVIRGRNFAAGTTVMWGDKALEGVTVTPTEISFVVPKRPNGTLVLRGGGLDHDLAIGAFEVAKRDEAAWKHHEDEQRTAAEAAWKVRAKDLAKDRAARDAELAKREHDLESSREERREKHLAEIRAKFKHEFLADSLTQAELALHAERTAQLERMQRLAADVNDSKLGVRIEVDVRRENDRHDQRMTALEAAFKAK